MHPPITTPDALHMHYGIRVHPNFVHPPHIKVLKHFVYIQYGCGIKSKARCSLNNDSTTSFRLRFTPTKTPKPKSSHDLHRRITVRVAPYAHTHHIKVQKYFVYI